MPSSSGTLRLTASERLILAAVRAAKVTHAPTAELHDAVCDYVDEGKARGDPPEEVLVAVKTMLAEAGVKKTGSLADWGSATVCSETELVDHVVTWCIDEYFRSSEGVGERVHWNRAPEAPR